MRITARSGPLSTSFTSSALSRSQCCFSKSASMFHASHCLGLSTKVCRRLPQTEFLGPPVSVSAAASDSIPLRLSNRLVMQPVCGSIFTRMNSFSRVSAEAFRRECTGRRIAGPAHEIGCVTHRGSVGQQQKTRPVSVSIHRDQLRLCGFACPIHHLDVLRRFRQLRLNLHHIRSRPRLRIK